MLNQLTTAIALLLTNAVSTNAFVIPSSSQHGVLSNNVAAQSISLAPIHSYPTIATPTKVTTYLEASGGGGDPDEEITIIHQTADATFAIIDVDGGGTLSRAEFTNHLSVSGYNIETISKIFNKMDVNKDEEISREEFRDGMVMLAALQSAPGLGNYNAEFAKEIMEDADQVFQSVDADGNGELDRDELRSHMGRSFANYSEAAIDEIFRQIDANDDGTITQEEFREAFGRSSALRQAIGEGPNYK